MQTIQEQLDSIVKQVSTEFLTKKEELTKECFALFGIHDIKEARKHVDKFYWKCDISPKGWQTFIYKHDGVEIEKFKLRLVMNGMAPTIEVKKNF